ncbi:MAG: aminotransferase class I/II-fold pyridoxal phosphate-dependent enzyme [Bacteroidia bacterium]|nr:aminotransferase class I/II-fold pyridoxal phosphate-dependent enzyme [Bacteroidia bacterium]
MEINRRQWLKSATMVGGFTLFNSLGLKALTIEEQKKFNPRLFNKPIKLSSNENPYGPSARVRAAITTVFSNGCRYPYSYANELAQILADKHGVERESIILTGGSTEGLKIAGITFTADGGEIIAAMPTFLAMMQYAEMWGANINWVPVDKNKGYDLQEIEKRISADTKMVFLCNPNNPTSTLLPKDQLMDFCSTVSKKTIVFSDEAYYEFIEDPQYPSMVELVKKGENVVVSKTFSKVYGLAGLRIGYLIAKPEIAGVLRKNVVAMTNVYAIAAAKEALRDDEFFNFSIQKNNEAKQIIYSTLDHLELEYIHSNTNFVFFHSGKNINELGDRMLEKGVRIGRAFPPFYDWCRISTGTVEEMQLFSKSLISLY